MARLVLALAALFVALAAAQGGCGSYLNEYTCLQQNEANCNEEGFRCSANSWCYTHPNTNNQFTGLPEGTCRAYVALGETCQVTGYEDVQRQCGFSQWNIGCDTTNNTDFTGVCRYMSVAYPGEACVNDVNYLNGGCVGGDCEGGKCEFTANGDTCFSDGQCNVASFCDDDDNVCRARLSKNAPCNNNRECQPTLVCTDFDTQKDRTCQDPFQRKDSQSCRNNLDCEAGLLCENSICRKPGEFGKRDACNSDNDCQPGWGCECIIKSSGDVVKEVGGKCAYNYANAKKAIDQWKKFQTCAQRDGCGDLFVRGGSSYNGLTRDGLALPGEFAPDVCGTTCAREAGFKFENPKDGDKCYSGAGFVLPAIAVVFAALFVVLGF